jgi:hypothetical protein
MEKVPSPMANRGATCYYNSAAQLLAAAGFDAPSVHEFIKLKPQYTLGHPHDAHECFLDLVEILKLEDTFYGMSHTSIIFPGGKESQSQKMGSLMVTPDGKSSLVDIIKKPDIIEFRTFKVAARETR